MCDMQNMPAEDASCEDSSSDMNFTTFQTVNAGGTHFVTSGQLPGTKLQQNVAANGATLQQVVGMVGGVNMGDGVQYMRTLDGSLQAAPQLISVPITLPGVKPGDPQPTVQIQVLNPNLLQQQQPKYQMQIPIQGFQPGAVITLAYSPETNEASGIQLIGNSLPEGLQVLTAMPQEMQLMQQQPQEDSKEHLNVQHQVYITPDHQIVINGPDDNKSFNNNTSNNNNNMDITDIVIKEECEDNDDESSQGSTTSWFNGNQQDLIRYLNTLPPQQAQALPASLQQFLRLNPTNNKSIEIELTPTPDVKSDVVAEAVLGEDGSVRIQTKKKRKYKKKPAKPARPKPGQIVIAQAASGEPIYCCPECHMAYCDMAQLEAHLAVHKIERRFICGICGAGLKRKEHLERHKMGHNPERPYVCGVCKKGFKRREHLNLHAVIHSGVKSETCNQCGKGFYRKDHLRKHTRSHESKRARDEAAAKEDPNTIRQHSTTTIMPEITIHVPTSANVQVPVQINIPQHVVTSLAAQQQQQQNQQQPNQQQQHSQIYSEAQTQLDALLAQQS